MPKRQSSEFLKYTGLGFSMLAVILIMVFIGVKLDKHFTDGGKIFTIIFSLLGVFGGIYLGVKDFIKQ